MPKKVKAKLDLGAKICVFGDNKEKNFELITNYGFDSEITNKSDSMEIRKTMNDSTYKLSFSFADEKEDKFISLVNEANCIFILFDMGDRPAFDNLFDKWLIWLRESCKYENKLFILGDFDKMENDNLFLAVNDDEVNDVINISELTQAEFIRLGDLSKEAKNAKLDSFILASLPKGDSIKKEKDTNVNSFDICLIY